MVLSDTSADRANHRAKLRAERTGSVGEGLIRHPLSAEAKWAYITRNVWQDDVGGVAALARRRPAAGDLLLAQVDRVAQHTKLHLVSGRRSQLFPGDRLVVAYGHLQAPGVFEAQVPEDLRSCHLVASGGLAARVIAARSPRREPTLITPYGFLLDHKGEVLNLSHYGLSPAVAVGSKPVICVVGSAMQVGKTTVITALTRGLCAAGMGVAALKVTGTGAGDDPWDYADAGADMVLDATDAGLASTYQLSPARIESSLATLVATAEGDAQVDVILLELADGLLHENCLPLLTCATLKALQPRLIFAAGEVVSARTGIEILEAHGLRLAALSGLFTASPLGVAEIEEATGLPVWRQEDLQSAGTIKQLLAAS
ncbi:MAG: molybdopterin-guanine dinucleotide biosynthesis protein MobB [Pseudomonadota bacterium]